MIAWTKGSILSYCILVYFNHKHIKGITNITKGKEIVGMLWERQQVSQRKDIKRKNQICNFINIAHVRSLRKRYAIWLLDWHIWAWWNINRILYTPHYMHSSWLTHICNKDVSLRPLQEANHLQIKRFMPWCNPQGWMLEKVCMRRYLLTR